MSTLSNIHAIQEYVSGTSVALSENVLVVSRGNAKSKTVSICVSAPEISETQIQENLSGLLPHIQELLNNTRGKIMRAAHTTGNKELTTEQLNVSSCIAFLDSESESARLTKEQITTYLNEPEQKELLKVAFAEALKYSENLTGDQIEKLNKMHKAFTDSASELSGSRTLWEEKKQNTMRKYLSILDDSQMKQKLENKIAAMKEREKEENVLEALGF